MSGFTRLHGKAIEGGALNTKTKELMALAISITVRCEGCIAYHTHDAVAAGRRGRSCWKPLASRF